MKVLISEKLSAHKVKTPEGYLICSDAILARTGKQTYTRNELFQDGDNSEVEVDRTPEEVFSEETLASFENKPLTITHPDEDVTPDNHRELGVGFVRDVRRATRDGQEVMIANIVVTDAEAIEAIESGELLELSCGYDCDISDDEHPCQRNIRGNHVALCKQGRAGNARIIDSKVNDTVLEVGKTYTTRSGAKLTVRGLKCGIVDYNGDAYIEIKYDWVSASGKKTGSSTCYEKDFFRMMTDKSLTGDSVNDEKCTESQLRSAKLGTKVKHQGKTFVKTDDPDLPWHNVDDRSHRMSAYALTQMNGGCTLADAYTKGDKLQHIEGDKEEIVNVISESTFDGKTVKKYVMKSGKKYLAEDIESSSWKKVYDAESELPEEEDSEFRYYDAYGQEIHVVNWDGRNQFMVIHKGQELMMNRRDVEYYLDRQGAKFSKVIRDSVKDGPQISQINAGYAIVRKSYWEKYKLYAFASAIEHSIEGARQRKMHIERDYGLDYVIIDCTQANNKRVVDFYTQEEVTKGMKKNLKNFKDSWVSAYNQFITISDRYFPDEKKIESEIQRLMSQHKNDADYKEAYRRWCENTHDSIKDAKYRVGQKVMYNGKQTIIVKIEHNDKYGYDLLIKNPNWDGNNPKLENIWVGENVKTIDCEDCDTNDAMQKFEITWIDTYTKSKGYSKDMWRFVAEIKANNLKEALQKLADKVALGGVGTANAFVVSIHSDNKSYQYSGKLSELLRKNLGDSKKEFIVKINGKKYKTQAHDSVEAVQNVEKVLNVQTADRLAPSQYAALKKLGYGPSKWKNLTSEQASRIIANAKNKNNGNSEKAEESQESKKPTGSNLISSGKVEYDFDNYSHISKTAAEHGEKFSKKLIAAIDSMTFSDEDSPTFISGGAVEDGPFTKLKFKSESAAKSFAEKLNKMNLGFEITMSKWQPDWVRVDGKYPEEDRAKIQQEHDDYFNRGKKQSSKKKNTKKKSKNSESSKLASTLSMQMEEADGDEDELNDVEYAIESAYEDGQLTEEDYNSLMEDLDSYR